MSQTDEVHVVLGASGGTGRAIVRELVSRGRRVRAVNRSGRAAVPAGVEVLKGDAANPDRMRAVCRGATVVYNCVNPPFTTWTETFPPIMRTRRRIANLGEKVRAEQGVARAVRVITNEQQRDGMRYSRVAWRRP